MGMHACRQAASFPSPQEPLLSSAPATQLVQLPAVPDVHVLQFVGHSTQVPATTTELGGHVLTAPADRWPERARWQLRLDGATNEGNSDIEYTERLCISRTKRAPQLHAAHVPSAHSTTAVLQQWTRLHPTATAAGIDFVSHHLGSHHKSPCSVVLLLRMRCRCRWLQTCRSCSWLGRPRRSHSGPPS